MDLICTSCGEPWDMDTVLHDEPHEFTKEGPVITACPCCKANDYGRKLSKVQRDKLAAAREVGGLLGDDVHGYAAMLEDLDACFEEDE